MKEPLLPHWSNDLYWERVKNIGIGYSLEKYNLFKNLNIFTPKFVLLVSLKNTPAE